jgi:hypothetical protein
MFTLQNLEVKKFPDNQGKAESKARNKTKQPRIVIEGEIMSKIKEKDIEEIKRVIEEGVSK